MLDTRRPLTVRLARDGATLRRSHHLGPRALGEGSDPWASLGKDLRVDDIIGLDALTRLLDRKDSRELFARSSQKRSTDAGEILFRTLFGPPKEWEPVLRSVFGQPAGGRPPPTFDAVRLRVVTTDPVLLGMPWRLASWQGKRLVSGVLPWTFEASAAETGLPVHFPRPARVLVVAPEVTGLEDLGAGQHVGELREAVLAVSAAYRDPAFFRVVQTEDDLLAALRGMRPHVVYYYGHAEVLGDQAALSLAGPAPARQKRLVTMEELKGRMSPPPLAVFVNGSMTGASGWHAAGHRLSPEVRVVVAGRATWAKHSGPAAIRWLQELLRGDHDPVALLDSVDAAGATATSSGPPPSCTPTTPRGPRPSPRTSLGPRSGSGSIGSSSARPQWARSPLWCRGATSGSRP